MSKAIDIPHEAKLAVINNPGIWPDKLAKITGLPKSALDSAMRVMMPGMNRLGNTSRKISPYYRKWLSRSSSNRVSISNPDSIKRRIDDPKLYRKYKWCRSSYGLSVAESYLFVTGQPLNE